MMSHVSKKDPAAIVLNEDDHLMHIKEAIWDARSQWKDIGRKLGLKGGDIRAIHECDDGECLHEVLLKWIHTGNAIIDILLKALSSKIINRSDITREILSRRGEDRTVVGLNKDEELTSSNEEIWKNVMLKKPLTLEELCTLPLLEDVWYQLGIWLGVEEKALLNISSEHANEKLKKVLAQFEDNVLELEQVEELTRILKKSTSSSNSRLIHRGAGYSSFMSKARDIIETQLDTPQKDTAMSIYHEIQLHREKKIISAMVKIGFKESVEQLKDTSLSSYLEVTDPPSVPPECVVRYAGYLKSKYLQMRTFPNDWPPENTLDKHYTNLALVKDDSSKTKTKAKSSTLKHDYIHGQIDNIVAMKENIELHEVFYPIISDTMPKESRLTILMDGAPGVGKTTITRKLCIEWAKGKMLKEYHLVVLIPVREIKLDECSKIFELFPSDCSDYIKELASYCTTNLGKRILYIFDGYDEAHKSSKTIGSLLLKIILGEMLPNCSILVTSRPYASGYLKSHSRFNRHVEVLGFSNEKIKECIQQNLSDVDDATRLIQMLKDRLDILSLCYIPLNCRIVLFVYKNLDYTLPSTLTELYETFILHTIKRHAEKGEPTLEGKETIHRAKTLLKLPPNLIEKLNILCELAFNGINEEKLSFDDDELGRESLLSLGLMNSNQTITVANIQRHFQFLHLTIQEFLAARYVASDKFSVEDKIKFFQGHFNENNFRMTLLFVAGLTKLNFHTKDMSLIGEQTLDFNSHPPLKKSASTLLEDKMAQKFLLCAHCAYEAQLDSSSAVLTELIPIKSKSITISVQTISPFEELIIAHFLSSTTADHIWEKIDFGKCQLPIDSILFTKRHKSNSEVFSMSMTKKLRVRNVPVSVMSPYFNRVQELSFVLRELSHKDLGNICEHLPKMILALKVIRLYKQDNLSSPCVIISKTQIIFDQEKSLLCSYSFHHFLCFLDYDYLQCISIPYQSTALNFCSECQHEGGTTLTTLSNVLQTSLTLKYLDFENCNLSTESVNKLLTVIISNKTSTLEKLNLRENHVNHESLKLLSNLLAQGTRHIRAYGYEFKLAGLQKIELCQEPLLVTELLKAQGVSLANFYDDCDTDLIFLTLYPFSEVRIIIQDEIFFSSLTSFIKRNNQLQYFSLLPLKQSCHDRIFPIEHICKDFAELASALSSHKHMERFSCPDICLTRSSILIQYDSQKLNICVTSVFKMLHFITETVESISIINYPQAFTTNKCECESSIHPTTVIHTLCELISCSRKFKYLSLLNCELDEKSVDAVAKSLPRKISHIDLHGNSVSAETISLFLANFSEQKCGSFCVHGFYLAISAHESHLTLDVSVYSESRKDLYKFLNCLKLPEDIDRIRLSMECRLHMATILLSNNSCIKQIIMASLNFGHHKHSKELFVLTKVLIEHQKIESILSFHLPMRIISRKKLWLPKTFIRDEFNSYECVKSDHYNYVEDSLDHFDSYHVEKYLDSYHVENNCLRVCSNSFLQLLLFLKLKPFKVKAVNIFEQWGAFLACKVCKTPLINANCFCKAVIKLENLQYLNLSYCKLCSTFIEKLSVALADKKHLEVLYLEGNECNQTASTCESFFKLMFNFKLKHLHLASVCLQYWDGVLAFKIQSVNSDLSFLFVLMSYCNKVNVVPKEIQLEGIDVNDDNSQQLALAIRYCGEILKLVRCSITPLFLQKLFPSKHTSTSKLKCLVLHSPIRPSITNVTQSLVHSKNLKELYIDQSDIQDTHTNENGQVRERQLLGSFIQEFLEKNKHVLLLSLRPCHTSLMKGLSKGLLKNSTLLYLDLSDNSMTNFEQTKTLECILRENFTLLSLNLTKCEFAYDGINHLASGLRSNRTLQFLTIDSIRPTSSCSSDTKLWVPLFESIKQHTSIHTLSVCDNHIDFSLVMDLVGNNKAIKTLKVDRCGFTKTQVTQLAKVLLSFSLEEQSILDSSVSTLTQ